MTEPNRPFEEWILLTDVALAKLKAVYYETPSYINDGAELNHKGLKRVEKYAAIVANLMVWAVQCAAGPDPLPPFHDEGNATNHRIGGCSECQTEEQKYDAPSMYDEPGGPC